MEAVISGGKVYVYPSERMPIPRTPDTPVLIFGDRSSMKYLAKALEHVGGYCHYSEFERAFIFTFSKQNMIRIHKQWGDIPITSGREYVAELKQKNNNLFNICEKGRAILEADISRLPTYEYKCNPLGDYQHRAVVLLNNCNVVSLSLDCGMGKTFVALCATEMKIKRGVIGKGKTLICAKLSTIETGWLEDCEKFTGMKMGVLWSKKSKKEKKVQEIVDTLNDPQYDLFVINHEGIKIYEEILTEKKFQNVILDESTILKGFKGESKRIKSGELGKSLNRIARGSEWKVNMSGTPAPNGPQDLWGQFYFLDNEGLFLEPNFNDFTKTYFNRLYFGKVNKRDKNTGLLENITLLEGEPFDPKTKSKIIPKKDTTEKIREKIYPITFRANLEDHIDLPLVTTTKRLISMTPEQSKHYMDMKEALRVELESGDVVTASVAIAAITKLRQITGGHLLDVTRREDGSDGKVVHTFKKNPKLDELDSILQDEIGPGKKVLIFAEYRHEVELIVERYKQRGALAAYGGTSQAVKLENIKKFKQLAEHEILVINPKSAAHGVNLTEAAYLIFYSISHSAEDNYQAIGRIRRATQKKPMFVMSLIARDSIDQICYDVVLSKQAEEKKLLDQEYVETGLMKELKKSFSFIRGSNGLQA